MRDGHGQLDVSHSFAADFGLGDLYPAPVTDNPPESDSFVFAAVAFPVFNRAEDSLAKEPVALRLERAIIDGFRLGYFTVRPG